MTSEKILEKISKLKELTKIFRKEKETIDTSRISYLAHRYARYKSGSDCCLCWGHPADESKGRPELKCYCGLEVQYTPAEKIAYEYQQLNEVK